MEFIDEVGSAGGNKTGGFCFAEHAAIFERVANLGVQLFPVGQDDDGRRTEALSAYLLRQKEHGITLAAALSVPEYTQFAIV